MVGVENRLRSSRRWELRPFIFWNSPRVHTANVVHIVDGSRWERWSWAVFDDHRRVSSSTWEVRRIDSSLSAVHVRLCLCSFVLFRSRCSFSFRLSSRFFCSVFLACLFYYFARPFSAYIIDCTVSVLGIEERCLSVRSEISCGAAFCNGLLRPPIKTRTNRGYDYSGALLPEPYFHENSTRNPSIHEIHPKPLIKLLSNDFPSMRVCL